MADSPLQPQKRQEKSRRRSTKKQSVAPYKTPDKTPGSSAQKVSSHEDLKILSAKRAYDLYCERGYRHGNALDDWLEAEREILSRIPQV